MAKSSTSLADGRALIYFDDRATGGHPEVDTRDLGAFLHRTPNCASIPCRRSG